MSILAQIIGLACLLFWGFWLCCKLRLPAGFAPLCGLCFCMVVLQLAGSCNQLWLGAQLLLVGAVLTLAQRRRHEILPQLLSPGVLAFCSAAGVLMAVFAIRQPEFQTWDEFSHWGIYFKSVFYQHRFAVWDTTRSLAEIKRRYHTDGAGLLSQEYIDPEVAASPQEAFYAPKKSLPLRETEGMVCSEFVMCYPPGIPILAPGERITAEILDYIEYAKAKGCSMTGPEDPDILRLNVLA